jgi:superfamily II DNA or RNA helicase
MKILVGDLYSSIHDPVHNAAALAVIRDICRARPNNYQYMPKFKAGFWDGYISLMKDFGSFPSGLLELVRQALLNNGHSVECVYTNDVANPMDKVVDSSILKDITLRDYQVEAANALIYARRGVAKMATNSGKTEVMAAVLKAMELPAIILTHRKELMYQTAERFIKRGITNVGMVGDGIWSPDYVTVAMIQTLSSRLAVIDELWPTYSDNKIVFIDECHILPSDQAMDVFMSIPGNYRYGVSGTPLKREALNDLKLMAATGPIVYEVTNAFMITKGYSAEPIVHIAVIEEKDDDLWDMNYQDAYSKLIVNHDKRNAAIVKFARSISGAVLILVNRIEHGKLLESLMRESIFVSGSDSTEKRLSILDRMRLGKGIFIATSIFDEGVDVPSVNAVVLAGSGASSVKLLQRIGRGLRQKEVGDNRLLVMDFIDDTNEHLLHQSSERMDTYDAEGFEVRYM